MTFSEYLETNSGEDHVKFIDVKTRSVGGFKVITYTVKPLRGRRGTDDDTYKKFPILIDLVPRGFSELFLHGKHLTTIQGLSKFDGTSSIDEDESENDTETGSIFDSETVSRWAANGVLKTYFTEKANGKFAIFKLFEHDDDLWLFGGSKNMHNPVRLNWPITGNNLHDDILRMVQADLKKLTTDELTSLIDKTVVGEYVDGKHIVYVEKPYMVYFWNHGTSLPIVREVLPSVDGLPSVDDLRAVREMRNVEGVVIKYKNTGIGQIILQKHKSVWYIIWRCWREVLSKKNKEESTTAGTSLALRKRLQERSDQFLHLDSETLAEWFSVADKFTEWLYQSSYQLKDCSPMSQVGMAKILHSYFSNTDTVKPEIKITDPLECLQTRRDFESVIAAAEFGLPVVVVMSGPSGSGKSTVTNYLETLLKEKGISVGVFSTDSYFMVEGVYQFDGKKIVENHGKNFEAFKASTAQVRIVDNTNLANWEYSKYFAESGKGVCFILYMKTRTPCELAQRSTHKVSEEVIVKMLKKFSPSDPAYYGLFPLEEQVKTIVTSLGLTYTQQKPAHVTVCFLGGKNTIVSNQESVNMTVDVTVIGYSTSDAGQCLVVTTPLGGNHITLTTNTGYKPYEVGTSITSENTTLLPTPVTIKAVYVPYYYRG